MVEVWLLQAVTFWSRPPYHFIVSEVAVPSFMTENIPPRTNVVLTYLKHLAVVVTANVPPPVITVGLEHGSPGLAVGGTVVGATGVLVLVGGTGVGPTGVLVLVGGTGVGPTGVFVLVGGTVVGGTVVGGTLVGGIGVLTEPPGCTPQAYVPFT
jgi:hypothetical protein